MIIGYARTSTIDQVAGLEAQIKELQAVQCEKIYIEHVSSVAMEREQLELALDFVREGDLLVVTKIDRLARSVHDLLVIIKRLEAKSVGLKIMNLGLDTRSPTGTLILTVLGAIAQFEREIMLERQREGIAQAKKQGKYKGRKPLPDTKKRDVIALDKSGLSKATIAKQLGIGEASVYRILADHRTAEKDDSKVG